MKSHVLIGVAAGLATCVSAQEPVITSFESDGTLTWSNAYSNAVASIEQLTDVTVTGATVTVTETLAVSDGSASVYSYTVEHPPMVNPSVTVSDGTHSWNDVTGSSTNPPVLSATVNYPWGMVFATYFAEVPGAGTPIEVEYSYVPVSTTQEWISVHSEPATNEVMQTMVDMEDGFAMFRLRNRAILVLIPAGTFIMGSPTNELGRGSDETQHQVTLTRDFFMQTTEVTNEEMADVLNWALGQGKISVTTSTVQNLEGNQETLLLVGDAAQISWNGSQLVVDEGKDSYPCIQVTWYGAQAYCNYLSDIQGLNRAIDFSGWSMDLDANGYRLPTESEWEYACRAGATTAFYTGGITYTDCTPDPNLNAAGWYCGNAEGVTHPVGQKQPNAWGLFDMHGNVLEWCWDWYGAYPGTVTDPTGAASAFSRMVRGGAWDYDAQGCRSARRPGHPPYSRRRHLGFRSARSSVP